MDKPFSEELVTGNSKPKFNLFLLIFVIIITLILVIIIIVLAVKLSKKTKDYKDIKNDFDKLKKESDVMKKYNQLSDQYKAQNNTLNDIFHIFQNLISATNITNNKIDKEKYSNIMKQVKNKIQNLEEGTYDFVTGKKESFNTGFHVDFETPSRNSSNYYNETEFDDIVYKLSCLYGRNVHINYYENIPHISYYCEDRDFAFAMGALFNQKYIWDWQKMEDIPNPFFMEDFF